MIKKECVAMLLAGGQGSRLMALTKKTAKPSVSFGGKYRIIDFALSNCSNSGIDTVGVLTQYRPLELSEYIESGFPWDLDRNLGGLKILPPYQRESSFDWYKGTAGAIWQNMEFIDRYGAEYVLVLSGDHIYKMDYSRLLDYHKKKNADATIAVINVPLSEASRFGIMLTDEEEKIYAFEEKPKNPSSTKASMGIYVFNKKVLEHYLALDADDEKSDKDFGKNVIPAMLKGGERLFAYSFEGYWKDVGTIEALWEANMDLLGENPRLDLSADSRIFSKQQANPPHFINEGSVIENSIITSGCEISGEIKNSVIGHAVKVERGARVENSVLFDGSVISENAVVSYAIIDAGAVIEEGARVIGEKGKIAVVERNKRVKKGKSE